jgi:hypothetical protein
MTHRKFAITMKIYPVFELKITEFVLIETTERRTLKPDCWERNLLRGKILF